MMGLDTNVVVRFLVDDDAAQAARARALVRQAIEDGGALFVSDIVLCEVVWVLASAYGFARGVVGDTLFALLHAKELEFADVDRCLAALRRFRAGKGDYSDYLIGEEAWAGGCEAVATFDGALVGEEGFVAPR